MKVNVSLFSGLRRHSMSSMGSSSNPASVGANIVKERVVSRRAVARPVISSAAEKVCMLSKLPSISCKEGTVVLFSVVGDIVVSFGDRVVSFIMSGSVGDRVVSFIMSGSVGDRDGDSVGDSVVAFIVGVNEGCKSGLVV
jgi:hypothetical protein